MSDSQAPRLRRTRSNRILGTPIRPVPRVQHLLNQSVPFLIVQGAGIGKMGKGERPEIVDVMEVVCAGRQGERGQPRSSG